MEEISPATSKLFNRMRHLDVSGVSDISHRVLFPNGKLKVLKAEKWLSFTRKERRLFCHNHARYGLPTREIIEHIYHLIDGRSAIEIGSGHGDLGYHLKIPMTDSKLQDEAWVAASYLLMGQPTIKYPKDVEKLAAISAVMKYKPKVVVGSWITTLGNPNKEKYGCNPDGIDEELIFNLPFVETFILVGNIDVHGDKPILKRAHEAFASPLLLSRANNPDHDRIFYFR